MRLYVARARPNCGVPEAIVPIPACEERTALRMNQSQNVLGIRKIGSQTNRCSEAQATQSLIGSRLRRERAAERLMGEVEQASQVIVRKPDSATARLRELFETMHRMNCERYVGDSKMHEMVAVAMEENWDVCQKHIDWLIRVTADVIGDGVASGEFYTPDIGGAALCVLTAMLRFIHPQFIAEFADKPTATLDQMIDFVLTGLSAPGHPQVA